MEIRSNTDNLEKGIRYLRKYPTYFKKIRYLINQWHYYLL